MALTDIASLSSLATRYFFRGPFSPPVTHTAPRPPHLRDLRLSQRTSLLSCALPLPHRSPPYPPRFPQVRPTVPASVRTTDSPAARRSFSVGKCCAAFRLPVSKLFNIHLFRINIQLFPLKLPHEAHPEIKPEIPGRKVEISCTQPCPAGWCRQGMVIFMRFYTHSLMRLNLPFYAVYRAIFMLLNALFCAVHCSAIFRPYYTFCVVCRIIFCGTDTALHMRCFRFFFLLATKIYPDFRLLHSSHCPHSPAFRPHFADDLPRRRDAGGGSQRAGTADTPPVHQPCWR